VSAYPHTFSVTKRRRGRELIKRLVLGPSVFPHQCAVGLSASQSEISVWLHGIGAPRDVTSTNFIAGLTPFVIGIGAESGGSWPVATHHHPMLIFQEQNAEKRILGEISLKWMDTLSLGTAQLHLFRALHSANYCLPKPRQWARHLYHEYQKWRAGSRSTASDIRVSQRELHCLFTFYICPRPVVLVSVMDKGAGNIFPMDLIGSFADVYFSLALHATSKPAALVENSRRIALSDIPVEHTQLAYELGKNHNRSSVDWSQLAAATTDSPSFRLPVPQFSLRVREMQIETVRDMGSHKLFLASTRAEQRRSDGLQLHFIHGFYQSWRERARIACIDLNLR
jgi:flavin reductase (DIM6/NTAB) family NADH-FMN oxidoreductase RutF